MTPSEIRFSILRTAGYDKAAAEIMVDFIKDDETRLNLFNLAFNATQVSGQGIAERATISASAAGTMYDFTGTDADKYQLFTECFTRANNGDVSMRATAASDEASKLYSIISGK